MFSLLNFQDAVLSSSSSTSSASPSSSSSSAPSSFSPKADSWVHRIEKRIPAIFRLFGHLVRGAVQQAALLSLITGLSFDQALVVIDWACKILENDGQMKQEDWFGRGGDSDSGSAVFSHARATSTDIIITYIDLIFQDRIKQNASMSHLCLKAVISQISQSLPFVRSVIVACDNGSGYHSGLPALFRFAFSYYFRIFCCDSSVLCLCVSFFLSFFPRKMNMFVCLFHSFIFPCFVSFFPSFFCFLCLFPSFV